RRRGDVPVHSQLVRWGTVRFHAEMGRGSKRHFFTRHSLVHTHRSKPLRRMRRGADQSVLSKAEGEEQAGGFSYLGRSFVLRHLMSRGLSFQAAYTVGKTIDAMSGGTGTGGQYGDVYDAWNLRGQRGLGSQDVPQRLALSYVWNIPGFTTGNTFKRAVT